MDKRKITLTVIAVAVLLVVLVGSTYAYWTANTQNKVSVNTTIQTGVLKLVLDDGTNKDGVLTGTIDPNNTKFTTYLSITNEGTYDTFAKLYFKGLTNTFSNDLVYSIEEVDSLPNNGSTPKIVKRIKYQVPVPGSLTSSRELLADGLLIKMGTLNGNNLTPNTQYYRVTVEYLWSETEDQSSDLGKTFYTGFDIEQGDKVTENIVMLDNIEDLVDLANEVNAGDNKSGKEYRLMRNLDFNSDDSYLDATTTKYGDINKNGTVEALKTELTTSAGWNPIGTETNPYRGDFNGQSYEIKNLYINNSDTSINNIGLFGVVEDGTISNLGIRDEVISSSVSAAIGGIVAEFKNSTMDNCYNTVTTKNDNVYNINHSLNENSVGGLIGFSNSGTITITNSYNDININGGNVSGGIIGYVYENANTINIISVHNSGNVIVNPSVEQRLYLGGIIGICQSVEFNIDNTYNNGIIENKRTTWNSYKDVLLGGIVGLLSSNISRTYASILKNSYNTGNIINGGRGTGGAIGSIWKTNIIINNFYNNGNITPGFTGDDVIPGGIIGIFHSDESNIYKSYILNSSNLGNIYSQNRWWASGICGLVTGNNNQLYIYNSYNRGDITSTTNSNDSGIANLDGNSILNVNNVYNIGNISGTYGSYGILGKASWGSGTMNVTNAYYKNNISQGAGISTANNNTTPMSLNDMKASSFVTTLNNNRSSITLPSELSGYTLSTWCTSDNGPVLDYQVPESERSTRCPAYNN